MPIVIGAVALLLFVLRQLALQKRDAALLDLRPFTHRQFVVALILFALMFMSLLGAAAILLPLFLQTVLGEDTFWTGLAVLPGGLVLGLLGRPVGALYDRVGARPLVIPGAIMMAAALWLFTLLGAGSPLGAVVGIHVVLMAGLGLMMTPLMTEGLSSLPGPLYSHGSAILATLQQVAGAFGTAAFVTISALASTTLSGTPDAQGLRVGFMAAGVVGVLAVVASLFMGGRPVPTPARPARPARSTRRTWTRVTPPRSRAARPTRGWPTRDRSTCAVEGPDRPTCATPAPAGSAPAGRRPGRSTSATRAGPRGSAYRATSTSRGRARPWSRSSTSTARSTDEPSPGPGATNWSCPRRAPGCWW